MAKRKNPADDNNVEMAYVGKAPCGHYRFASVICEGMDVERHSEDILEMIRGGWTVHVVRADEAGALLKFCDCAHKKRLLAGNTVGG